MVSLKEEDTGEEEPMLSSGELNEVLVDPQGMARGEPCQEDCLDGGSPLLVACKEDRAEDAHQLLEAKNPALSKEHINHVDKDGATALMWAIVKGMKDIVFELIARGAKCDVVQRKDTSTKMERGHEVIQQEDTPLILACYGGLDDIAMELLKGPRALNKEHISHKNLQGHTALDFAINNKMFEVKLKLVADGHPLLAACKEGREKKAIELLRIDDNINYVDEEGETALTYAIGNHMKDIALELIRRGAKRDIVTRMRDTPLQMACRKNKKTGTGLPEVAKELLNGENKGMPGLSKEHINLVKPYDHPIIYHAINSHMTDIAVDLIRRGARCNVPTIHGETPLGKACTLGLTEVAKELLKGSDEGGPALTTEHINHKNVHGAHALANAISSHMLDVMKILIDRGSECKNMLYWACGTSFGEGVVYLLTSPDNKKHIDAINVKVHGMMPLEWAVKNQLSGAIVELLKQGASLKKRGKKRQKRFHY